MLSSDTTHSQVLSLSLSIYYINYEKISVYIKGQDQAGSLNLKVSGCKSRAQTDDLILYTYIFFMKFYGLDFFCIRFSCNFVLMTCNFFIFLSGHVIIYIYSKCTR